jgi:signal transduction histidine kinase
MKKLRNKIFYTVLGILSLSLLAFIVLFNVQHYNEQKDIIRRTLGFNGLKERNNQNNESVPTPPNRNIRFMDTNAVTIILDENDNIIEIINHSNSDVDTDKVKEVANKILSGDKEREYIGSLYTEDYSYSYRKGRELIIIDNSFAKENLLHGLKSSLLYFMVLEIIFIFISKKITKWISEPVEDAFNKQKDFIADASHELKTPLAVIIASTDELKIDKKNQKYIENIKYESERMNTLIKSLLDLSKLENGVSISNYKEENISKIIEKVSLTFEAIAFEHNIKIDTNIKENITFKCSKEEIEKLISIIIDNAVKHSYENSSIIVNTTEDKNNIVIEIINSGDPIKSGDEEKIFERFYREDKSRNRDANRYGLGLAIAKNIVINHSGTIKAFSKDGKTHFTIILKK